MTTEEDFQNALDADPTDWQTRLVFADWLDERGDPRGPGYRAMGLHQRLPVTGGWRESDWGWRRPAGRYWKRPATTLPRSWWNKLDQPTVSGWPLRSHAEDAAAVAFSKLPAAAQAKLLGGNSTRKAAPSKAS